jgi:hypothetical protein
MEGGRGEGKETYLVFSVQGHDTGFVCADDGLACFHYAGGCFDLQEIRVHPGGLSEFAYLKFVCDEEKQKAPL